MVISAKINPPIPPTSSIGTTACGFPESMKTFQVHAAVATTHNKRNPVLLTVPRTVIASPIPAPSPSNAFGFNAGFEVLIKSATVVLLLRVPALHSSNPAQGNTILPEPRQIVLHHGIKRSLETKSKKSVENLVALTGIEPVFQP